ncbi:MAG TPA: flagellar hook assembly protein FlgD [Candidatus Binatia bacterium]|nr:flagellar hook assembly protein FlgD [Candidatus Binatia bacterium]
MAMPIVPLVTGAIQAARSLLSQPRSRPPQLDQEAFLRLLVAELRNQDPLQPLDNHQMMQQTAAFSQLQELARIRAAVETGRSDPGALAAATSLLGRMVTATAASFTYAGATVSLPLQLAAPTRSATLEVLDGQGRVVASVPLGALPAGPRQLAFPPAGTVLAAGMYRYRVVDVDEAGLRTPVAMASGVVSGVTVDGGEPLLRVGPARIRLSDIAAVDTAA